MTDWDAILDRYEERMTRCATPLDGEDTEIDLAPWPPHDVPNTALPPELVGRAEALLERSREIERLLDERRAVSARPRAAAPRARRSPGFSSFSADL